MAPDRVHLIELPLGSRRTVNAVLVEGDPLTIVDTGVNSPESLDALERALKERGRRIEDLEQIVITHAHPDHFGAAAELVRRSGARVLADNAATLATYPQSFEPRRRFGAALYDEVGAPEEVASRWKSVRGEGWPFADEPLAADQELREGDELRMGGATWRVLSTPGHDASSITLYQPETKLLITGDIVVGNGGASVTLHVMDRPGRWLLDIFDSLQKLAALDVELAYPGHGALIGNARQEIADRLARARTRLAEVGGLVTAAPRTAYDVSSALYPAEIAASWMGMSQSIGYLEALEAQGRARSALEDKTRRYEAGT